MIDLDAGVAVDRSRLAALTAREADAFRARIEALRADMGEGWLKVFTQSHMGSPPPAARTPEPVPPSSRS